MKRWYSPLLIALALLMIAALALFITGGLAALRADAPSAVAARSAATRPALQPTFTPTSLPPTPPTPPAPAVMATAAAPTAPPLPTATPLPTPTEVASARVRPPAPAVALGGLRHQWQTWNNCGPATLAINLSYYGSALGQEVIGAALRRSEDDKNVSPEELASYAQAQGYTAVQRVNGSAELLKLLVSNGFPVLIETWLEEEPNDGMGHYRLITGYDDALQSWIAYDTYVAGNLVAGPASADKSTLDGAPTYAGIYLPYAETDALWKVFNRTYLLIYPPDRAAAAESILGDADAIAMWQGSEARAQAEIVASSADAYAWFNLGSSLWALGRPEEAAIAFDQARALGLPWRMFWYQFAPFATYAALGRSGDVIALADSVLVNTTSIEEVHYWRGRALADAGDLAGARAAYDLALSLYPGYADALDALADLAAAGG